MNQPAVAQHPTEDQLRAWDWRAELAAQERTYTWLARHTDRAAQTVYQYRSGQTRPSIEWLRAAWSLLNGANG
jgi:hypothetical protein